MFSTPDGGGLIFSIDQNFNSVAKCPHCRKCFARGDTGSVLLMLLLCFTQIEFLISCTYLIIVVRDVYKTVFSPHFFFLSVLNAFDITWSVPDELKLLVQLPSHCNLALYILLLLIGFTGDIFTCYSRKTQVLLMTVTMSPFYSSVPVSPVSQHAEYQDPKTEATKWN